ncbi:MAG: glycosyl hydrolase, partial [Prolixibacteraceae bacterium]
ELEESKANGMAGYDIWDVSPIWDKTNKVPPGPPFMGKQSTNAVIHAIKEATRLDMEIGIMVASSWNSGGSWVKQEHGVQGILDTTVIVSSQADLPERFPFPELPDYDEYGLETLIQKDERGRPKFYLEVAVLAVPDQEEIDTSRIIDISDRFQNDKLDWQVPEGKWRVTRYVCTSLGVPLKRPSTHSNGLMIDHFSKEAQRAHLKFFIDKLQPKLGDLGETALKYLYNDSYEIKGPVWTPDMPEEFKKRRGYSIIPFLPVLDGKVVQNRELTERFLYDYRMTLSDLAVDNHYKFGVDFCNDYGIGYHAEGGGPGPPLHQVPVESIKALGALSVPRGEFWHKYPLYDAEGFDSHWFVKGIASAAHLYDQTYVEAESFTSLLHWQEGWQDLKPTADQAFCEGLNRLVFHTSTHSPDEFGSPGYVYAFGTHMNTRQPWWPKARAWNDYLGRNSYMLQQGNFVGDILYYYGDQAPNFAKQRHIDPSLGFGYDYDVINTEKILELEVKDGKMTLPHGQEYALLVLPDQETMPLHVLQKIEQLLNDGALVVGPKPEKTPGLLNFRENEKQLNKLARKLWKGLSANSTKTASVGKGKLYWGKPQRDILVENGIYPDFHFKGQDDSTSLNFIHRRTENAEIYFVRNRRNEEVATECVFRVKDKAPQLWIPETGETVGNLIYSNEGDSIRVALNFAPYDAFFIVFTDAKDNAVQKVLKDGKSIFPAEGDFAELKGYQPKTGGFNVPGEYTFVSESGNEITKSIEPVNIQKIEGPWKLSFPFGWKAPESAKFDKLQSWTESEIDGIKYFSGIAKYEIDFEMDDINRQKKYLLDLGDVRELADVWLNGKPLGIVWHQPFQLDVTDAIEEGTNHLVIDVANEWNNRLVGDGKLPESERVTNTNIVNGPKAWGTPWKNVPLKPAGILGPVEIKMFHR